MNKIFLMGRLVKDPEVRYTQSSRVVAMFTLAVDRPYTSADGTKEADFIPVQIWGKQAETCGNSLGKGQRVLVEGRLQIRAYDDKTGIKRYVAEVVADRFEFIERKNVGAKQENAATGSTSAQDSAFDVMGEDIPF